MADTKITGVAELDAVPAVGDWIPFVDVSDTTMSASGTTKRINADRLIYTNGTANTLAANLDVNSKNLTNVGTATATGYYGGTASGGTITISSTTNATKGKVIFGGALALDEANNRLGIGNSEPANTLEVLAGSAVTNIVSVAQAGVSNGFTVASNGAKLAYTFNDASSFTVGGPTSINVAGSADTGLAITKTSASDTGFGLFIRSARTQSSAYYNILTYADYDGTPDPRFYVDGTGACAAYTFPSLSDVRTKNVEEEVVGGLEKIANVKAYRYTRDGEAPDRKHIGFLAHEIRDAVPECVTVWPKFDRDGKPLDSDLLAVDYTKMVPVVLIAIKELAERLQTAKDFLDNKIQQGATKLADHEQRIRVLEAKVAALEAR